MIRELFYRQNCVKWSPKSLIDKIAYFYIRAISTELRYGTSIAKKIIMIMICILGNVFVVVLVNIAKNGKLYLIINKI